MKTKKALLPFLAAFMSVTSVTNAAIVLTNDFSAAAARTANGANTTDTIANWSLVGGNTVAVLFTAENSDTFTATFGGQSMDVVFATDGNRHLSGIAYLINPTVSIGNVVISANNNGTNRLSHAYSVVSLSGVGSVAGTAIRSSNGTLSYTTTDDGGYVLGAATNGNHSGPVPTFSGNVDLALFSAPVDGNYSGIHVVGDVETAGNYSDTYGGGINSAITVAFDAIPEPSSALLGGLGLLALLRRRR